MSIWVSPMVSNNPGKLQTDWFDRWLSSELMQWTHLRSPSRHLRTKLLQRAAKQWADDASPPLDLRHGGFTVRPTRSESRKVSLFARLMQRSLEFSLLSLRWVS